MPRWFSTILSKNDCFYFNASVHTVLTRRCNDIRIPKVNQEFAMWSFYFTNAVEFKGLPRHIKSEESFTVFYFYWCTLKTGPPLIPRLITLTGLSCINIIIIVFTIIIIAYDIVSLIAHWEVFSLEKRKRIGLENYKKGN